MAMTTDEGGSAARRKQRFRMGLLMRNTAALSIGRMLSKLMVFFMVRVYTYVLTDAEYGTADLVTSLCNLLIPLACGGLSSGFFRFVADARGVRDRTAVFSSGVCILGVMLGVFVAVAPLLHLTDYFSDYVLLIVLYVLSANLHYLCSEFVRGEGNYILFAVQGLVNTALNIGLTLVFLFPLSMKVSGYILGILGADLLTSAFLIVACRLWRRFRVSAVSRTLMRDMLAFCLPLIPATLCWWVTNVSDRYMVSYFCGEGANGLYAAAYKIPNLLTICCGIFIEAWQFSAVMENRTVRVQETPEQRAARKKSVASFFTGVLRGYVGFLSLVCGGMILLSRVFAGILFDPSFAGAWVYIPTLLLATAFSALSNFCNSVYTVEKRSMPSLLTATLGAVTNVILNFLLIPRYAALGAAIATMLSYLLMFAVRLFSAKRYIRFRPPYLRIFLNLLLLLVMTVAVTAQWRGWVWIGIGIVLCLAGLNLPSLIRDVLPVLLSRRRGEKRPGTEKM